MNAELGTWEPAPAYGNVYHAKHVELHDMGPSTEGRLVCEVLLISPQVMMPSEICTSRREHNIKVNLAEVGCVWDGFIWHRTRLNEGLL
jgi:hypothetical protein